MGPSGTHVNGILLTMKTFPLKHMSLELTSAKYQPLDWERGLKWTNHFVNGWEAGDSQLLHVHQFDQYQWGCYATQPIHRHCDDAAINMQSRSARYEFQKWDTRRLVLKLIAICTKLSFRFAHYSDVVMGWARWRLKSPVSRLLAQPFVQAQINKTSKLPFTGFCEGNSPVTGEFPTQRARNAENVFIWLRYHGNVYPLDLVQNARHISTSFRNIFRGNSLDYH